jgi:hypothetical protein
MSMREAQVLKQYAPILTDLPYTPKFMLLLNTVDFPRLHTIHISNPDPICVKFLKRKYF